MFYLIVQTGFILLVTAVVFFALGTAFHHFLQLRRDRDKLPDLGTSADSEKMTGSLITDLHSEEEVALEDLNPPVIDPSELERLRVAVTTLQEQLLEKERVIDGLSQAMPAPTTEAAGSEVHLMSKIPQMEAALETQGALLESKSLALEKAKAQIDREKERASLLEQKLLLVEAEANELRNHKAQALWDDNAPPAAPGHAPAELEAKETELTMLRAERDQLREEVSQLQASLENAHERSSGQDAEQGAEALWQDKVEGYEKDLEERRRIERSLRDEIDSLRHQIEKQSSGSTRIVDGQLMERLARAEAIASERREESRQREKEIEDRYAARVLELEATVDSFQWEKESLAKAQGRIQTLENTLNTVTREKEELARTEARVREMERELETLEAEKHGLERFAKRVEELERELDAASVAKYELESNAASARQEAQDMQAQAARVPELERTVGQLRWEMQEHTEEAARVPELERKIDQLREEVGAGQRHALRVSELERELDAARDQANHGQRHALRISELERDLAAAREHVNTGQRQAARISDLELQLEAAREQVGNAQQSAIRVSDLERELDAARDEAETVSKRLLEVERQLDDAQDASAKLIPMRNRVEELEQHIETLKLENEMAPALPTTPPVPSQSEFQKTAAEFQRLLSEFPETETLRQTTVATSASLDQEIVRLREEWIRKDSERSGREQVRLETIQRKLEQIEAEILAMEQHLKRDGESELVSAIWRVETMLKDHDRLVAQAGISPARETELKHQVAMLERELSERDRLVERLSKEGVRDHHLERDLQHQIEAMQALVAEREKLIATLKKQLSDLSHKVDPSLVGEDNLLLITGVGPYTKKVLKEEFGIMTFRQLARLTGDEIQRISDRLFFKGRIQREDWLGQAMALHFKKYNELVENPAPPYPTKWAG